MEAEEPHHLVPPWSRETSLSYPLLQASWADVQELYQDKFCSIGVGSAYVPCSTRWADAWAGAQGLLGTARVCKCSLTPSDLQGVFPSYQHLGPFLSIVLS